VIDALPTLFAHQGGWDETLFILAPVVVFAVLLILARRRVGDLEDESAEHHRETEDG
jgi:cytochrome c oxidase assembly factor CtaG